MYFIDEGILGAFVISLNRFAPEVLVPIYSLKNPLTFGRPLHVGFWRCPDNLGAPVGLGVLFKHKHAVPCPVCYFDTVLLEPEVYSSVADILHFIVAVT